MIVVEPLEVLVGRLGHRTGGRARHDDVTEAARLVVVVVERVEEDLRGGRRLADSAQQLAAQIALALRGEIALLAHVEVAQGLLQGERIEIAGGVLEGRILLDAFEQRRVADAEIQALGVGVDRGTADKPLQHAILEPSLARLLHGEAAAGVGAHHAQDVALRARIFLLRDLGIADLDQGLAAIAPENVGNSPNGEAYDEQAHQDHAEQAACSFSQIIKYHAGKTFLLAVCNHRAEGSI